ncbi:hypothetical protein H072_9052 [Dactylellina haptotyla CBS 200.50]|uniref:Uncharacterized protein n=1 Tax=Dactylellina haptotyla (strain CBS 200.50) TaxID=1284197 RepID=S8BDJ9_DACHA|nr:hypothetical protein H072_9052 [Dactylellina haptotyla CBS 200.50]
MRNQWNTSATTGHWTLSFSQGRNYFSAFSALLFARPITSPPPHSSKGLRGLLLIANGVQRVVFVHSVFVTDPRLIGDYSPCRCTGCFHRSTQQSQAKARNKQQDPVGEKEDLGKIRRRRHL